MAWSIWTILHLPFTGTSERPAAAVQVGDAIDWIRLIPVAHHRPLDGDRCGARWKRRLRASPPPTLSTSRLLSPRVHPAWAPRQWHQDQGAWAGQRRPDMKLSEIAIKNFRLLRDTRMRLDTEGITTILVGPNNSGKTSAIEAMLTFLQRPIKQLSINDFSLECRDTFKRFEQHVLTPPAAGAPAGAEAAAGPRQGPYPPRVAGHVAAPEVRLRRYGPRPCHRRRAPDGLGRRVHLGVGRNPVRGC